MCPLSGFSHNANAAGSADAILHTDLSGTIQSVSDAAVDLTLTRDADKLLGQPLSQIAPHTEFTPPLSQLLDAVRLDGRASATLAFRRDDGSTKTLRLHASQLRHADEPTGSLLWRLEDPTEIDRRQQIQKMQALSRFAGTVAHDINNHLTVIKGHCDLVGFESDLSDNVRESILQISQAYQQALNLTSTLLSFSGREPLEPEPFDPGKTIEAMRNELAIGGEGIRFNIHIRNNGSKINVDPSMFRKALSHLATNAIEAMPDGGELTVAVENQRGQDQAATHVAVTVSDTGTGIDPETLPHVFEPFFGTRKKGKGTGIGLTLVHHFVTHSGGEIICDSRLGAGTSIHLRFPQYAPAQLTAEHDDSSAAAEPAVTQKKPHASRGRILVVDDNDAVRRLISRILEHESYEVFSAADAGQAWALLEQHDVAPDLLIVDVIIPDHPGPQFAAELTERFDDMEVIYVSGYTRDVIAEHGVAEQALFLRKPFSPKELALLVAKALDDRRSRARELQ